MAGREEERQSDAEDAEHEAKEVVEAPGPLLLQANIDASRDEDERADHDRGLLDAAVNLA